MILATSLLLLDFRSYLKPPESLTCAFLMMCCSFHTRLLCFLVFVLRKQDLTIMHMAYAGLEAKIYKGVICCAEQGHEANTKECQHTG